MFSESMAERDLTMGKALRIIFVNEMQKFDLGQTCLSELVCKGRELEV